MFVFVCLVQLLVTGYWQIGGGQDLARDRRNPRLALAEGRTYRGSIFDRRLRPLAQMSAENGRIVRWYPRGPLFAHIIGYQSERLGRTGLERAFDTQLRAPIGEGFGQYAARGDDVVLTVDADVQTEASEALGGRPGAVVVLEPRTGAILALAALPSFDPNTVDDHWGRLHQDAAGPLLNRATQGVYAPGSVFKPITMAAALDANAVTPAVQFYDPGFIDLLRTRVTNYESRACGRVTMFEALVYSCNVVFIQVGLRLGGVSLREYAGRFGIGSTPSIELPAAAGHLPSESELEGLRVGQMAFGQGSLAVSPLQMALVAATIAAGGERPVPRIVSEIRGPGGNSAPGFAPPTRVVAEETAKTVTLAMIEVVRRGTGQAARIPGVTVAGKTGTATVPGREPHAWFVGFAPADSPRVAIAVVLENGGVGGRNAAPIAGRILRKALELTQ